MRAGVAQLVEHLICNQRVGGSNPSTGSTSSVSVESPLFLWYFLRGTHLSFCPSCSGYLSFRVARRKSSPKPVPIEIVNCAICRGTGLHVKFLCEACNGQGTVKVLSPAKPCRVCCGSGASISGTLIIGAVRCTACRGTGWAGLIAPEVSS